MINKLLLIFSLLFIQLYSSQEYPVDYEGDVPNGAYYKDLNGDLNKYVGLWKGIWNGKTVYLEFKKVKDFVDGNDYYYKDRLYGERKIINSNGIVEIDRIINFDVIHPEFRGLGFKYLNKNIKQLSFYPKNMCGTSASIDITNFENTLSGTAQNPVTTTKMTLHLKFDPNYADPTCIHNAYVDQYDDWPINFPKDIVLTKQ